MTLAKALKESASHLEDVKKMVEAEKKKTGFIIRQPGSTEY